MPCLPWSVGAGTARRQGRNVGRGFTEHLHLLGELAMKSAAFFALGVVGGVSYMLVMPWAWVAPILKLAGR